MSEVLCLASSFLRHTPGPADAGSRGDTGFPWGLARRPSTVAAPHSVPQPHAGPRLRDLTSMPCCLTGRLGAVCPTGAGGPSRGCPGSTPTCCLPWESLGAPPHVSAERLVGGHWRGEALVNSRPSLCGHMVRKHSPARRRGAIFPFLDGEAPELLTLTESLLPVVEAQGSGLWPI